MNHNSSASSAVTVLECDDLFLEILLKLPQKLLFKFKCVSRRWNDKISKPYFRHRYISQRKSSSLPLLGFFHGTTRLHGRIPKESLSFLSTCEEGKPITSHNFLKRVGFYAGVSSDGLILCGLVPKIYYVYNPITNQFLKLPKPSFGGNRLDIGFCTEGCSDDGVIHFKVVMLCHHVHDLMSIETFSSRTGKWVGSKLTCPAKVLPFKYKMCHAVGGIFYWKALGEDFVNFIAAYDSSMRKNHFWLIRLPQDTHDIWPGLILTFGESRDGLLQCALPSLEGFSIWVLKKKLSDYISSDIIKSSEWILRRNVLFKDLLIYAQNMDLADFGVNPPLGIPRYQFLRAFHPQDSRLVYIQLGYMIFCYNSETQGVEVVKYEGKAHLSCLYEFLPFPQAHWPGSLPHIGTKNSRSRSSSIKKVRFIDTRRTTPDFKRRRVD